MRSCHSGCRDCTAQSSALTRPKIRAWEPVKQLTSPRCVLSPLAQKWVIVFFKVSGSASQNGDRSKIHSLASRPQLTWSSHAAVHSNAGNRELVKRITRAAPLKSLKITWAFITKAYARSPSAARELFFSDDLPPAELDRCEQARRRSFHRGCMCCTS